VAKGVHLITVADAAIIACLVLLAWVLVASPATRQITSLPTRRGRRPASPSPSRRMANRHPRPPHRAKRDGYNS
jgi:hypothetical protein